MGSLVPLVMMLFWLALMIFVIAGVWKTFVKAGHPGIACIIPIWNMIVYVQMAGKPIWWFLLLFIPLIGIIFGIIVFIGIAENFGKGVGFALGLIFLPFIFFPILGFGDAQYQGVRG